MLCSFRLGRKTQNSQKGRQCGEFADPLIALEGRAAQNGPVGGSNPPGPTRQSARCGDFLEAGDLPGRVDHFRAKDADSALMTAYSVRHFFVSESSTSRPSKALSPDPHRKVIRRSNHFLTDPR